jgi:hypothetical protein
LRTYSPQTNTTLPDLEDTVDPVGEIDAAPCEELVRPLFVSAVADLSHEDRLLIKMLVLDDVPQKQIAQVLSIHSGNVTKRRQRVADTIWRKIREAISARGDTSTVIECLQLLLAGSTYPQRQQLAGVLADEFRAGFDNGQAGAAT